MATPKKGAKGAAKKRPPRKKAGQPQRKSGGEKTPAVSVEDRVQTVLECLLDGLTPSQIFKEFGTEWDVTSRTVENYCAKARERWNETLEEKREQMLNKQVQRLERFFAKQNASSLPGSQAAALGAIREMNRLLGLHAPTKIAPTNPEGDEPYTVDPVELLKSRLARLSSPE